MFLWRKSNVEDYYFGITLKTQEILQISPSKCVLPLMYGPRAATGPASLHLNKARIVH